jgi:hypothetical protein
MILHEEMPDGDVVATEFATDADVLLAAVVSASVDDGWRAITSLPSERVRGNPDVVLRRVNVLRELQIVPLGAQSLLQLWDVPDAITGTPMVA